MGLQKTNQDALLEDKGKMPSSSNPANILWPACEGLLGVSDSAAKLQPKDNVGDIWKALSVTSTCFEHRVPLTPAAGRTHIAVSALLRGYLPSREDSVFPHGF